MLASAALLQVGLVTPTLVQAAPFEERLLSENTPRPPKIVPTGKTYSASASNPHPNTPASAFDESDSSAWIKDNATSGWLKVDLGLHEQSVVGGLEIT